ncbi:MAG: hypothetical protein HQ567_22420 [Candidatus Nealsonbacteria bacterium]|nr:hypothetical protein [Candidatus Nealsonbacteria bacterium]
MSNWLASTWRERPDYLAGAPAWITPELIDDTIDTWQPYYEETLTAREALDILMNVGRVTNMFTREHSYGTS